MKLFLVFMLTAFVAVSAFEKVSFKKFFAPREPNPAPESVVPSTVVLNHITSQVDNFDPSNHETFQQRFYMNGQFFQPGGPLYVFLGGEWPITPYRLMSSLMVDSARDMEGYIFYLEHRFYGESFPTDDASDDNLRFLSPEQALADVAHFIEHIKRPDVFPGTQDSPVIVIGGHYSGTLAAWFRQQYPHLAIGAWASSAPVLSVINQHEFKEVAGAVYRQIGGNECYDRMDRGFDEMEAMVAAGEIEELSRMFRICDTLESDNDIAAFFAVISEFYSLLAQFSQIIDINYVCELITSDENASNAEGVAKILNDLLEDECIPLDFESFVEEDRQTALDSEAVASGVRQITYQMCVQLGWHHTSDGLGHPFGSSFPLQFSIDTCEAVFGNLVHLSQLNSDRINVLFGGLNPEVNNVIFTQGMNDPWRTVGIQQPLNDLTPTFVIPGASQANDLGSFSPYDSVELNQTKMTILYILEQWIRSHGGVEVEPYKAE